MFITFIKFKAGILGYSGASMLSFLLLSIAYRYAIIHENANVHRIFMSKKFQFGLILFLQIVSIIVGQGYYGVILSPEVCSIRIFVNIYILGDRTSTSSMGEYNRPDSNAKRCDINISFWTSKYS
jgi:hypothetical protein